MTPRRVIGKISRNYETRQALCFGGRILLYWYISATRLCCLLGRSVVGGIGSWKAARQRRRQNLAGSGSQESYAPFFSRWSGTRHWFMQLCGDSLRQRRGWLASHRNHV